MDQIGIDYIKKSRELGRSDEDIKALLLNAGRSKSEIDAAFDAANGGPVLQKTDVKMTVPTPAGANPASSGNSSLQIRTNFWAGLMIWANPFVVILVYLCFYYALNFFAGSNTAYVAYLEAVAPIIGLAAIIFAVWLGVRSVKNGMWVDPKNFMSISLYSAMVPFLFVVALLGALAIYNPTQANLSIAIAGCLFTGMFFFVLTYYFLGIDRRAGYAVLILSLIVLTGAILQGYVNYEQTVTINHAGDLVNLSKL